MSKYISWGLCRADDIPRQEYYWQEELTRMFEQSDSLLVSGNKRSYGDSCLNSHGCNASTLKYNRFVTFDRNNGRITCCSGLQLSELNDYTIPLGWFVPVTPGTKAVTLGGMIANDVHGKNHHIAGTFGNHVKRIGLMRSDTGAINCSLDENPELFAATIGGLGLTGAIMQSEVQLKPVPSSLLFVENHAFCSFREFNQLSDASDAGWEYTVAWLDGSSVKKHCVNGIFSRGNHLKDKVAHLSKSSRKTFDVPFIAPNWLLNHYSMQYFNRLYFAHMKQKSETIQNYDTFFYPLDGLNHWSRLYGKRGFFQYQCVLPSKDGLAIVNELLIMAKNHNQVPYLSVLKRFGKVQSVGLMSFPQEGYSLAIDFPNCGAKTLELLSEFDVLVTQNQGRIYPAKDARMAASTFASMYPELDNFKRYVDPKCSSDFWRRVCPKYE